MVTYLPRYIPCDWCDKPATKEWYEANQENAHVKFYSCDDPKHSPSSETQVSGRILR